MKRLVLASLVLAVGCPKKQSTTPSNTTGSGSGVAVYAKKMLVSWGISAGATAGTTDVFLQTTDETGAQVSHAAGAYPGTCAAFMPAPEMKAMNGVRCVLDGGQQGTELHAVKGNGEVIVVRAQFSGGVAPDPMDREQVLKVDAPSGAAIEAAPQ